MSLRGNDGNCEYMFMLLLKKSANEQLREGILIQMDRQSDIMDMKMYFNV